MHHVSEHPIEAALWAYGAQGVRHHDVQELHTDGCLLYDEYALLAEGDVEAIL
jgi:hypothetical protein